MFGLTVATSSYIILIKIVWHASRSQVFLTFFNSHDLTHERESHEIDCRAKYF